MKLFTSSQNRNYFLNVNIFSIKQPLKTCLHHLKSLWCWLSCSLSEEELQLLESLKKYDSKENETLKSSKKENWISRISKAILRQIHALVALVGAVINSKELWEAFPRIIGGLVLLVIVAPYADVFYTKLDPNDRVPPEVWYYESYNWLFLCLGPYLKNLITLVGLYFCLIHRHSALSYIFIYPLTFDIGKILWLLQVTNHSEYLTVTPRMFLLYGASTAAFLITILNLLSFWLFHRVHAIIRRLHGIRNIVDKAEPKQIVDAFVQTMDDEKKVSQFNY